MIVNTFGYLNSFIYLCHVNEQQMLIDQGKPSPTNDWKLKDIIKKKHIKMNSLREIANELKNTNVELTKESRMEYAKAIKKLVPTVDGHAYLSDIAKKWLDTVARVIGTDSNELGQEDRNVMARLLEVAATLVENPTPRCIKISKDYYNSLVNDSKIEELIVGRYRKMAKLESGEVVIYEINAQRILKSHQIRCLYALEGVISTDADNYTTNKI